MSLFHFYGIFVIFAVKPNNLIIYMEEKKTQLPENAHRELKPGEEYQPLLSPQKNYPEAPMSVGDLYGLSPYIPSNNAFSTGKTSISRL